MLPTVGVGYYSPATCVDTESAVDAVCTLICPSGYLISSKNTVTESRVCQENGTWKYTETSPTCRGMVAMVFKQSLVVVNKNCSITCFQVILTLFLARTSLVPFIPLSYIITIYPCQRSPLLIKTAV